MASLIIAVVLAIFAIVLVASAVRIVRQSHVGMIERFGKYRATLSPGLHIVIPFFDRMRVVVDMRETVQPFAPQPVITQDNVTIAIDTVVYFQVTDAFRATYGVANFLTAMEQLDQTTLRNLVGAMTLEETLTSRDQINTQLREVLDEATEKWGVRVTRVELKSIDPPRSIQEAMEQQMRADRAKRATMLQAEGEKQSAILRAEGARQAAILAAEADQQSHDPAGGGRPPGRGRCGRSGEAEALRARLRHGQEGGHPAVGHARLQVSGGAAGGRGRRRQQAVAAALGGFRSAWAPLPVWARHSPRALPRTRIRRRRKRGPASAAAATPPPDEEPPLPKTPRRKLTAVAATTGRGRLYNLAPAARDSLVFRRIVDPDLGRLLAAARCNPGGDPYGLAARRLRAGRHRDARGARLAERRRRSTTSTSVILGVAITIFVLVGGFLLYSSMRFRERRGDTHEPPQTHGSTRLEMGWTIVPDPDRARHRGLHAVQAAQRRRHRRTTR